MGDKKPLGEKAEGLCMTLRGELRSRSSLRRLLHSEPVEHIRHQYIHRGGPPHPLRHRQGCQIGKTCCEAFVVLDFESKTPRGCDDNDRESSVGLAGRLQKIDFINGSIEKLRDSLFYLSEGYRLYYDRVRFLFCENSETIMFLRHNPRVFARIRRNHFRMFCLE